MTVGRRDREGARRAVRRSLAWSVGTLRPAALAVPAVLALSAVPAFPVALEAQAGRARVEEGNRLYRDGLFEEAHQKYLEAMAEAPGSPVVPFNDGNALYQNADYARAMEAYQRAIETGDAALAGAAWYNLGNALYRQQQLEPALEAYKQALRMNPADVDSKHNLERVLEQMQQQEQEQEQQQQQGDSDDEGEQDEQQQNPQQAPQQGGQGESGEGEDEEQPPQQPQDEPGQDEQDDPSRGQEPEGSEEPPQGEAGGEPQPDPDRMSEEEAERLLDAIDENPEDVNRRPASARGRHPRKPW